MFNDDLFRHIDDIMRSFSNFENRVYRDPWDDHHSPFDPNFALSDPANQRNSNSLRDQFLDDGYRPRHRHGDEDLDRVVARYGVDSVMGWGDFDRPQSLPVGKSYYKSFTFSSNSNGNRIEERKIETDSSGRKIESHTRRLGDKVFSVTSKSDSSGVQEIDQNLLNLDENEVDNFEQEWKSREQSWFTPRSYNRPLQSSSPQHLAIEDKPQPSEEKANPSSKSWMDKLKSWVKL